MSRPSLKQRTSKSARRSFKFQIGLQMTHRQWVREVLDAIENDTVLVFDPNDDEALCPVFDAEGREIVNARAKIPVSIREWLPAACQYIYFDENHSAFQNENQECFAVYSHNACEVLFPFAMWSLMCSPIGPSAFIGKIVLNKKIPQMESENWFKCAIAHEFVHCFDTMRFLVPAVMNWRSCWQHILQGGSANDVAQSMFHTTSLFIDDYGGQNELTMLKHYWPSSAEKWFNALRANEA